MITREFELAGSIIDNRIMQVDKSEVILEGIRMSFGFGSGDFFDYTDCTMAIDKVFRKTLPSHWIKFLKQVEFARSLNHCDSPINLLQGVYYVLGDEARSNGKASIPSFARVFNTAGKIEEPVNNMIKDSVLSKKLSDKLVYQVQDISSYQLDYGIVADFLRTKGVSQGLLLDLGCGVGRKLKGWRLATGLAVLGLDRQYAGYYGYFWRGQDGVIGSVRADFIEGIPLREGSVDVACMQCVADYIDRPGLAVALKEVTRVFSTETGYLAIGPQSRSCFGGWRIFQKQLDGDSGYKLKEILQ